MLLLWVTVLLLLFKILSLWAMVLSVQPIILMQPLKMPHLKMIAALRPMSAMLLPHPLQQARFL